MSNGVAEIPRGTLKQLQIKDIIVEGRFRENLGNIEDLCESIKEKGILQPITVGSDMKLLAGGRRVKAATMAGLTQIPALVRKVDGEIDALEIELMENTFRKDFDWAEQAALVKRIHERYMEKNKDVKSIEEIWSKRKTAALLGKSIGGVVQSIKLAEAMTVAPELGNYKTADEANKAIKKLEEQVIIDTLRNRQKASQPTTGIGKDLKRMLDIADGNYTVGDTFKGMAALRTGGVVHIIECDPPYGIDLTNLKASKDNVHSNVHTYNEVPTENYAAFLDKLATELFRVAGRDCWLVFWYGPTWHSQVLGSLRKAGWEVDEIPCIWTKGHGQTMQPEKYLARTYEPFFLCRKGQPVLMKRGRANVFAFAGEAGQQKWHPTQRPVPLIEAILETLGTPASVVLVPFLGSGATLRAAYNQGMKGFGFDMSAEYKDKFMLAVEDDVKTLLAADEAEDEPEDDEE